MNCEKCKNKKATVFFADEGGGKHALCATCNASRLKTFSPDSSQKEEDPSGRFFPSTTVTVLSQNDIPIPYLRIGDRSCNGCGATEELISSLGHALCPECYGAFLRNLSPIPEETDHPNVKKPYAIKEKADKARMLRDLREQLKCAIESESFEKAAALRDKIRAIEPKAN